MELTLRPGRHEIIERHDLVHEWRVAQLARLGIPWPRRRGAPGHPADANHPATRPRRLQRASRIIKE